MPNIFFFQAEDGIRDGTVTGVQTCALPIFAWNASVNGGVLVYITAFPSYQRSGWHVYGGTSAASPQLEIGRASCRERVQMSVVGVSGRVLNEINGKLSAAAL